MVQRIYVKCPSCGKIYQLKLQIDQNIKIYEWPISFECIDCGDNLTYKFRKSGLFPKEFTHTPSPQDPSITTIGYSSSLPITDELYMKCLDYEQSMALFSPFMNLSFKSPFFSFKEIRKYDVFLTRMQQGLLPYKGVLNALLPILKKGNVEAFSKKMATLLDEKKYKPLDNTLEMYDSYFELLKVVYLNIAPQRYLDDLHARFIKPLGDLINKLTVDEVRDVKVKLDASGLISKWYKDEALPFLAKSIDDIQKIIPAMIYASAGIKDVVEKGDLKIVTIGCDDVMDMYKEGYEVFAHGLKILVGLNNLRENSNIDVFTNSGLSDVDTITKFAGKAAGKMIEVLEGNGAFMDYMDGSMNNKIRNAASHSGGVYYDPITQHIECYYDATDDSKEYETTLMAVVRICHVLIVHLIETTLLARQIVEKAK